MTNQQKMVLDYIKNNGSITPMDAFYHLAITKLATRISELKRQGYKFAQAYEKAESGARYMRYSLKEGE